LGLFGGFLGVTVMAVLVLLSEAMGRRLKSEDDLRRVTRLPVIATLGDVRKMSATELDHWSFLAWAALQRRLNGSDHGTVCGIISSSEGEGGSTWTRLLARAASQRGHRVLTIFADGAGQPNGDLSAFRKGDRLTDAATVTANVLAAPGEVTHQLIGPNARVILEISLPNSEWSFERRKQLEAALEHWRSIENVVILIHLPPASKPQTLLLAGQVDYLVWLADSGRAKAAPTRIQVETLRQNRCRLVGAVLNHAPSRPLKNLFPRWVAA
jgi:hypothetical protein